MVSKTATMIGDTTKDLVLNISFDGIQLENRPEEPNAIERIVDTAQNHHQVTIVRRPDLEQVHFPMAQPVTGTRPKKHF